MTDDPRRRTRRTWLVALGILLSLLAASIGAPPVGGVPQPDQPDVDNTVTRIRLYENGSAGWTVQIRTRLRTEQESEEYEAFQSAVQDNTSRLLAPFETRMRRVVAAAANATGREMHARAFSVSVSIQEVPRRWGVVTYEFRWTNFAARENRTLVVGDVFQGGFFLAANDTLEIVVPEGYTTTAVAPPPAAREGDVLVWVGREDFADTHPSVKAVPVDTGVTDPATATSGGQTTDGSTPPTTRSRTPAASNSTPPLRRRVPLLVGGIVAVIVVGMGAYRLVTRHRDQSSETGDDSGAGSGSSGTANADPDVLTDPERVEQLLEAREGRVRQGDIASELGWSASKTSRIISRMVDEGVVEKLQLGRENVISLRDRDREEQ